MPGGFGNFVKSKAKKVSKEFSYDDLSDDYDTYGRDNPSPLQPVHAPRPHFGRFDDDLVSRRFSLTRSRAIPQCQDFN